MKRPYINFILIFILVGCVHSMNAMNFYKHKSQTCTYLFNHHSRHLMLFERDVQTLSLREGRNSYSFHNGGVSNDSGKFDTPKDSMTPASGKHSKELMYLREKENTKQNDEFQQIAGLKNGIFQRDNVKIYPNPFTDYLIIEQPVGKKVKVEYRIFNTEGKLMSEGFLDENGNSSSISELPAGTYVLNIEYRGRTLSYKIMKEE